MILSFIKLDINILSDTKIKLIRSMKNGDSILILWIGLLCLAMKSSNPGMIEMGDGIPFTDEILSTELGINLKIIKNGMEIFKKYKMIEEFNVGEIFITNFNKHQEIDKIILSKVKSKISSRIYREKIKSRMYDVTVTPLSRDDDVLIRDNTEEEKEEDTEQIKKKDLLSDSPESDETEKTVYPESFEKFWSAYPKKEGKGAAYKSYQKIKAPRPTLKNILDSIETHKKTEKWKNKQFIPLPATFLNQRRWEDEFTPEDFNGTKQATGYRDNEPEQFYPKATPAPVGYK